MNRLQRILLNSLPREGDPLPICGMFFRKQPWNGVGPLPYPKWFIKCCRAEAWVIIALYRLAGRAPW